MKFSDVFKISRSQTDVWFDPILSVDTRLFVDPFLIYEREEGPFEGAHDAIIAFFNSVFRLIARSVGDRLSLLYRHAVDMLRLPEVEEVCLGYSSAGTRGSGSGGGIAKVMAGAIWEAIAAGMTEITHFEEIAILREGIGADRISDATIAILRDRFANYTKMICDVHGVGTETFRYLRGRYDAQSDRWISLTAQLPLNPYTKKGILLVPEYYLRDLPTVNASDFWEYMYYNENETIRNEFSHDVSSRLSKADIIGLAKRHPDARERYIQRREATHSAPYPLRRDPDLVYQWYSESRSYVGNHPLQFLITDEAAFGNAIRNMIDEYKHFVEENKGWRLLWNENRTPRREASAQDLFLGIIKHYCAANNVDVSREADIGRGPVDFKLSTGAQWRALIEVKLARNSKFWNGLERQLPTYLKAERVKVGFFLVIVYTDEELLKMRHIATRVAELNKQLPFAIEAITVDARHSPQSASKL